MPQLLHLAHIDGLVKERCNSIVNALELRLSCTNPSDMSSYKPTVSCSCMHTHPITELQTEHLLQLLIVTEKQNLTSLIFVLKNIMEYHYLDETITRIFHSRAANPVHISIADPMDLSVSLWSNWLS